MTSSAVPRAAQWHQRLQEILHIGFWKHVQSKVLRCAPCAAGISWRREPESGQGEALGVDVILRGGHRAWLVCSAMPSRSRATAARRHPHTPRPQPGGAPWARGPPVYDQATHNRATSFP
jgi:hypothetical protein